MSTPDTVQAPAAPESTALPKQGLRIEAMIFLALTIFFFIAALIYTILQWKEEPAGAFALWLTAGLSLIVGSFLFFSSRRLEGLRPEDDEDAEVSDGAGELGFFSPGSYWPFAMAFAAAWTAVATAFLLVWLMIICIGFLIIAIAGLLFEYQRRPAHH